MEEESTSVFVMNMEESSHFDEPIEEAFSLKPIDPSVLRRIKYLSGAFQKEIYTPLQFVTENEVIKGTIQELDGETLTINLLEEENTFVSVEISSIEEILWRGKPFREI